MPQERLHKVLAEAGIGSRRRCEELILEHRVLVDGRVVKELGLKVDPERAEIVCNGVPVRSERKIYLVLNKPRGVVCTHQDPAGRPRVVDLLARVQQRVFPVGRLDVESEGLLIVTNDGALCNQLTHPRYEVPKSYSVIVKGRLDGPELEKVQKGIWLSDGKPQPARVRVLKRARASTALEITLKEGKNREVRRIFARVGRPVSFLRRTRIGGFRVEDALGWEEARSLRVPADFARRRIGLADALAHFPARVAGERAASRIAFGIAPSLEDLQGFEAGGVGTGAAAPGTTLRILSAGGELLALMRVGETRPDGPPPLAFVAVFPGAADLG
jgi:pseudouridine synthase